MKRKSMVYVALLLALSVNQVFAQPFLEIGSSANMNNSNNGWGAAVGDFDGDGLPDVYLCNTEANSILYRNNGNGSFSNASSNLSSQVQAFGAGWADYDNDGDLDLYVARSQYNQFYENNGSGTLTNVNNAAGVADNANGRDAAWADFNLDGHVDLFVANGNDGSSANRLYLNNGNKTFSNIASSAGLADGGNGSGSSWADYDGDGDPDLFMMQSGGNQDRFYRNNGNNTFTELGTSLGIAFGGSGSGVVWGDIDNDGDLDLHQSNSPNNDKLFQNNGNATFSDITSSAGVSDSGNGTGQAFGDYDNDGDLDLYLGKGGQGNRLFQNNGSGVFTDVGSSLGVHDTGAAKGTVWFDMDNDGDLDLFVVNQGSNNRLYRNDNISGNKWLHVNLTGVNGNKGGIGAIVTVVTGATRQVRQVEGSTGYFTHTSLAAEFGLGSSTNVDSLIVQWPSGTVQSLTNLTTNQTLSVTEDTSSVAPVTVTVPDTIAGYASSISVPVRIEGAVGQGVVAAEVDIVYDTQIVTSIVTDITATLVALGWSVEENIFSGSGGLDTLSIAMSTAQDTIDSDGVLILLDIQTADIRHPASTALELVDVLLNDGTPSANKVDGSLTLVGADGIITANPDSIEPGETITITVTDVDFDLDVGSADQVSATAISKLYSDSQDVTLTETGVNTGIFTGSVNTLFALAAGPSNDGVITTIAGDSICVSFADSLSSVGTTVTRYDTVEVIGGEDGEVLTSFVVQALDGRNGVRDTVRVQVTDNDLDVDVGVANQVSVTITNDVSGESESVTLTETGVNTGIFQVRVPTIYGASGTNNDGELSLASEDTLSVTYVDALTAQGGTSPVQDVTQVVNLFGDVRSNDNVQAFDAASILAHAVSLNTYTDRDSLLADVDGNGDVQAFDASQVLQYVVRLIDRFPVQTDDSITPPGDLKNHPFLKPVLLNQVIALGELQSQDDGTFLMPISLTERSGILSATLEIAHSEHVQVLDVTPSAEYDEFMVAHNAMSESVRIGFAGAQSDINGSGDILYLHIKVQGDVHFSLDHLVLNGQILTPTTALEVVEQMEQVSSLVYALHQNQPNPFNPETTIRYQLAESGDVALVIYNMLGQQVRSLVNEVQETGYYQVVWDGKDSFGQPVSSGVYFYHLTSGKYAETKRMILLK